MKKTVKPQLPAGFKAISGGGNSWKPEKPGESIMGKFLKVKTVHLEKKGKIAARDVQVYTIETKDGQRDVWQSAGLKALELVKKGQQVYVQYVGKKVIAKGQQPMREFVVAVK